MHCLSPPKRASLCFQRMNKTASQEQRLRAVGAFSTLSCSHENEGTNVREWGSSVGSSALPAGAATTSTAPPAHSFKDFAGSLSRWEQTGPRKSSMSWKISKNLKDCGWHQVFSFDIRLSSKTKAHLGLVPTNTFVYFRFLSDSFSKTEKHKAASTETSLYATLLEFCSPKSSIVI